MRNKFLIDSSLKAFTRLVIAALFCLAAQAAFAQIDQGAITGTIIDETGSAIQGAITTLVNQDTNLSFTGSTDSSGFYRFSPIKIGL